MDALSREDCLAMLADHSVGRIAVTSHALPVIVPVNYALSGHTVVFRTEPGGMLARACADAVVAFEVDELARDGSSGRSVLVVGVATLLTGSQALRATELRLVSARGEGLDQFIGIAIGRMSNQ